MEPWWRMSRRCVSFVVTVELSRKTLGWTLTRSAPHGAGMSIYEGDLSAEEAGYEVGAVYALALARRAAPWAGKWLEPAQGSGVTPSRPATAVKERDFF